MTDARVCADCPASLERMPASYSRCGQCFRDFKRRCGVERVCTACGAVKVIPPGSPSLRVLPGEWQCIPCLQGNPADGVEATCTRCRVPFSLSPRLAAKLNLTGDRPILCRDCRSTRASEAAEARARRLQKTSRLRRARRDVTSRWYQYSVFNLLTAPAAGAITT
jgi:hypothetical protein